MPDFANEQLSRRLHDGKAALRRERQQASLDRKVLELWFLQRLYVDLASVRRQLEPWQRPWDIRSDVRETVVFGEVDAANLPVRKVGASSPSIQHRWVLAR
jgi:hypothetical protein